MPLCLIANGYRLLSNMAPRGKNIHTKTIVLQMRVATDTKYRKIQVYKQKQSTFFKHLRQNSNIYRQMC